MTQVIVMVTLHYPGREPDLDEVAARVETFLEDRLESGEFPGCSQIEAEAEEDVD